MGCLPFSTGTILIQWAYRGQYCWQTGRSILSPYLYFCIIIHTYSYTYTFMHKKNIWSSSKPKGGKSCRTTCIEWDDEDLNHIQTEMMRQHRNSCSHLFLYNMFVNKWQSTLSYLLYIIDSIHYQCTIVFAFYIIDKRMKMCTSSI